jgi:phosphoglycolate phosphatase
MHKGITGMKYKNIFLDFDGTVSKSGLGIINALEYMFKKMGMQVPEEKELIRFIGPPVKHVLQEYGIIGEDNERAYTAFREYYGKKGVYEMELYAGMPELLEDLSSAGAVLHIATGKRGEQAEHALDYLNIRRYFKHVFGAVVEHNIIEKKDILKKGLEILGQFPESPVMVGDRAIDITGGKQNGLNTIGVLYGYGDEKEIRGAGPDHIAKDVAELRKILLEGE